MTSVLLFAIYVVLVLIWQGVSEADATIEETVLAFAAPLLAWPVWWAFQLPATIAVRETDLTNRVKGLRKRLTPRFEIGTVRQVFTNNLNQDQEFICLTVRNISEQQSDICEAHLTELRSDTGASILDPVELYWMGGNGDQHWGSIPSGATRTVKVFRIWEKGLGFNMSVVPKPFLGVLENAGTLMGKIAFDDRYWGGQYVHFVVHAGDEPGLEIVQTEAYSVEHQRDPETVE